ncbi:FecCD family ABC transporter permease [Aneurinibacillus thermoaerophilus]|uniref:Iron ABC transporter permease n=1 Tax=Aneurinibacillus thermoaerophilus TaxID=143495 RepID=A0ABX8YED0_ANETH|nr:iron ABC transporter permease [Aneurinibacillus thermoaerophilus]MED0680564.1 iron ABC transporter permease [Aneurinibacillus thermoaerophilus]MED0763270.1 iron ABC transporter permease [Aneurinibacillus thermoaerophilus]QYY44078.1 iron ABC transporter permease [Aneurinibacillus thermoaerophilus]
MKGILTTPPLKIFGLIIGFVCIVMAMYTSIVFGVIDTNWKTVVDAYTHFNGTNEHIVIKEVRVPRAFIALAVGTCLGISGVLIQALTRNPLADVGILGINAGASLFIVIAVAFFSFSTLASLTWVGFFGAAASGLFVYFLGSLGRDGATPLKLTLAGAAIYALCSSLTQGVLLFRESAIEEVLFWLEGSVAGRKLDVLVSVLPYMIVAIIGSLLIAKPINTLMLGEDVAKGVGQRTALVKAIMGILLVMLAGSSIAAAGPISFVGLIIPHIARFLVGIDTRWMVLYSAQLGAILLLIADILARFVAIPKELPIGVITALLGVPFFIYVARKGVRV